MAGLHFPIKAHACAVRYLVPRRGIWRRRSDIGATWKRRQGDIGATSQRHRGDIGATSQRHRPDVGPKSQRHRPDVGPTSQRHRPDVAAPSARHRPDVAAPSQRRRPDVGPTSQRHRPDIGPTSQRHRSAVGPTSADVAATRRECPSRPPYTTARPQPLARNDARRITKLTCSRSAAVKEGFDLRTHGHEIATKLYVGYITLRRKCSQKAGNASRRERMLQVLYSELQTSSVTCQCVLQS